MGSALLVGIGGFLGSVARYLVSGYVQQISASVGFPYGTLVVNLTGCLIIGFLSHLSDTRGAFTPESRALIFVGILGGYTTFSTFGNETMNFLRTGEHLSALVNVAAQVGIGLFAVLIGRNIAYLIWR